MVNECDEVVGSASRSQVHGDPALIHRVAHVLVLDSQGRLFLQKRSTTKDVQPGRWDTSVGGHVNGGEDYGTAATREMAEELGVSGPTPEYLYHYLHSNDYESEMVSTFRVTWDGEVDLDPAEIDEGRFWTADQIAEAAPEIFTPDFLDELVRYQKYLAEPR